MFSAIWNAIAKIVVAIAVTAAAGIIANALLRPVVAYSAESEGAATVITMHNFSVWRISTLTATVHFRGDVRPSIRVLRRYWEDRRDEASLFHVESSPQVTVVEFDSSPIREPMAPGAKLVIAMEAASGQRAAPTFVSVNAMETNSVIAFEFSDVSKAPTFIIAGLVLCFLFCVVIVTMFFMGAGRGGGRKNG